MKRLILCLLLLGAGGVVMGQAVAPTLAELKKQFETAMRDAQKAHREDLKAWRQTYSDNLTKLQMALQAKGEMQAVLTIREEKSRFEQAGEIPTTAFATEPAALRKVQDEWNASCQQVTVTQSQKLVALSEKYMQQLAQV